MSRSLSNALDLINKNENISNTVHNIMLCILCNFSVLHYFNSLINSLYNSGAYVILMSFTWKLRDRLESFYMTSEYINKYPP